MTHVLISSVSKKIPLLLSVREALETLRIKGKIYGADADPTAIGRFFVDHFWQMPTLETLTCQELIEFCRKEEIRWIIPTRDGELPFFAMHRETLKKEGIFCMISKEASIETSLDKLSFFQRLAEKQRPVIPTYLHLEDIVENAYVVKERFGAGSMNLGLNLTASAADIFAKRLKQPIFQPFIHGEEYSVDLYVDLTGTCRGTLARRRQKVVHGESQITTSVRFPRLEKLCEKVASDLDVYGHAVFQVIDAQGELSIVEANLRFGGASTLAIEMGLNSFAWFFLETIEGDCERLPYSRSKEEKTLIRYPKDQIFNDLRL